MKKLKIVIPLLILLIIQSTNINCLEPVRDYFDQVSFIGKLSNKFSSKIIGQIKYGTEILPIYKISYNLKNEIKQKRYIVICGVHGNEPAPVFATKEFLQEIDKKPIENPNISIDFIYIVNPWGFVYDQRFNGENSEINRDLELLVTQEAKIIKKNFRPLDYEKAFDFHEASAKGFFLYCYGNKNRDYSTGLIKRLREEKVSLETGYTDIVLHANEGVLYVPFYATIYMGIKKRITVGQYFINCKNSFTFETPKGGSINERKRIVNIILRYIIEN